MKKIKIIEFLLSSDMTSEENKIEEFVNDGWVIVAGGGGSGGSGAGFVVLQKE